MAVPSGAHFPTRTIIIPEVLTRRALRAGILFIDRGPAAGDDHAGEEEQGRELTNPEMLVGHVVLEPPDTGSAKPWQNQRP